MIEDKTSDKRDRKRIAQMKYIILKRLEKSSKTAEEILSGVSNDLRETWKISCKRDSKDFSATLKGILSLLATNKVLLSVEDSKVNSYYINPKFKADELLDELVYDIDSLFDIDLDGDYCLDETFFLADEFGEDFMERLKKIHSFD